MLLGSGPDVAFAASGKEPEALGATDIAGPGQFTVAGAHSSAAGALAVGVIPAASPQVMVRTMSDLPVCLVNVARRLGIAEGLTRPSPLRKPRARSLMLASLMNVLSDL